MRVSYRVFANAPMSGTFSVLDTLHANWNGPSLFMYLEGQKQNPVSLAIAAPPDWTIINGEVTRPGQRLFHFGNYDLMIDTPTEVAPSKDLLLDSFVVDNRFYRVMVHHNGPTPSGTRERFVRDLENIVRYQNSVFTPPPLEQYTFLFNIGFPGGDGMEHLALHPDPQSPRVDRHRGAPARYHDGVARVLPRLEREARAPAGARPLRLHARSSTCPSLWVAEGWTQYYGFVTLRRGGIEERLRVLRAAWHR